MKHVRIATLLVTTLLALGFVAVSIVQKEQLVAHGRSVFLELAPVDPRSLIQGDYMNLRYAVAPELSSCDQPQHGQLLLQLDARGVVQKAQVVTPATQAGADQVRLSYRTRGCEVQLGAESFFFQEGEADRYAQARYAELKVAEGESVLVGLRGPALERLDEDSGS